MSTKVLPKADILVAQTTPAEKWVLALRDEEPSSVFSTEREREEEEEATGAVVTPEPSLEMRISMNELKELMEAFRSNSSSNNNPSEETAVPSAIPSPQKSHRDSHSNWVSPPFSPKQQEHPVTNTPRKAIETLLRKNRERNEEKRYDRKLSTNEFLNAMKRTVPSATEKEIRELINKVDYEAKDKITWDDFSTFLTAQSRRREYMSSVKLQFVETPEPATCPSQHLHQTITCYTIEKGKGVILTGGSEGAVRAWGIGNLSYRGLILLADSWVTGVHFSHKSRSLYVCTMNHTVYVLDGHSFEVQKVFKGRATGDTPGRVDYAASSTRNVRVGGVPFQRKTELVNTNKAKQTTSPFQLEQMQKAVSNSSDAVITSQIAIQSLNRTDNTMMTEPGTGPYVERIVQEGVLAGLIDNITASLYYFSKLGQENLLLGTSGGDIYIFKFDFTSSYSVYLPESVLHVHNGAINKIELFLPLNAIISSSEAGTVVVTSAVTGKPVHTLNVQGADTAETKYSTIRDFAVHTRLKLVVTVGGERYGLVWDMLSEKYVTQLEPHNAPLKSCAISDRLEEIITCGNDGTVHMYDCNGYQLVQRIELGRGYAVSLVIINAVNQSLLCFSRYPFQIHSKRHAVSDCPANYTGHFGSMLGSLYSSTFDQIITIDNEALAMTWVAATGKPLFSFVLNDFSDSATMNAARISSVNMDGLQRRILTGFHNGAMVVWNGVNGQPINFMTAGIPGASKLLNAGLTEEKEEEAMKQRDRPWRVEQTKSRSGSLLQGPETGELSDADEGVDAGEPYGGQTEITATGSLVRRGMTFFLFANHKYLFIVRESTDFTTATASKWALPAALGNITTIVQVGEHIVALGMSSGAIVMYHVLSERQDGQPLFVKDFTSQSALLDDFANSSTARPTGTVSFYGSIRGNFNTTRNRMSATMSSTTNNTVPQFAHITASVTKIIPLTKIHEHLFLSIYVDGTVALWQNFRRLFLGSVNLLSGVSFLTPAEKGTESSYNLVADVDASNRYLVFCDEAGDVHVCEMEWKALCVEDEKGLLGLKNPATYSNSKAVVTLDVSLEEEEEEDQVVMEKTPQESNRELFTMKSFKRINVFGTGLGQMVNILLITKEGIEPIVVCTATSRYTRVFNLKGEVMGELGNHIWDAKDPNTYRLMNGNRPEGSPPPTITSVFSRTGMAEVEFDYLEDASIMQHMALTMTKKPRKSIRHRSLTGSMVSTAGNTTTPALDTTQRLEGSLSRPSPEAVTLAGALRTLNSTNKLPEEEKSTVVAEEEGPTRKEADAPPLSTMLRQSTRQRYLEEPHYKGIVKQGYAAKVRQQTAMKLTSTIPASQEEDENNSITLGGDPDMTFRDYSEIMERGYVPYVSSTVPPHVDHEALLSMEENLADSRSHYKGFNESVKIVVPLSDRRNSLTLRNRGSVGDSILATTLSPNEAPQKSPDGLTSLLTRSSTVGPSPEPVPLPVVHPSGRSVSQQSRELVGGVSGKLCRSGGKGVMLKNEESPTPLPEDLSHQHLQQIRSQLSKSVKHSDQLLPQKEGSKELRSAVYNVLVGGGVKNTRSTVDLSRSAGKGKDNHNYLDKMMVAPINPVYSNDIVPTAKGKTGGRKGDK